MKVNQIIPGDLEANETCTTPHPSHKISVKSGKFLMLSNSKPKEVVKSKTKTSVSTPPCWSLAIGENRPSGSSSVSSASSPSINIGKDTFLVPIRISLNRSSQDVPRSRLSTVCVPPQEKHFRRRSSEEKNGYCKSKERSGHPVTTTGGSSMVPGRACAKRKRGPVVNGDRDKKRPCFQDLGPSFQATGCKAALDHGLKPKIKGWLKAQEVAAPAHIPSSSRTPVARAEPGLEPPGSEAKKGPAPSPAREDPDAPPPQCAQGKPERQAARGRSPSRRASQPEKGGTSSASRSDGATGLLLPAPPRASTSPLVSLSPAGGSDATNASPLAGSCFPESPVKGSAETSVFLDTPGGGSGEDRDLSDLELDLGAYANGVSSDSDDEPLLSLQEILDRSARLPATPEKGAYPAPDAPVRSLPLLPSKRRPVHYKNTLEQILKEKEENQRSREAELKLRLSCKEDLLKLAEDSTSDGTGEEGISQTDRAILKKFSVNSNVFPDVHPGEAVFTWSNFGRFFSQQTLDLRTCAVTTQNAGQKLLLQASPDELLFLISTRMLLKAYRSSPCQPAVSRWLFQMMSVHFDRETSTQILRAMTDIALNAADQIAVNKSRKFEVWTPSIQDIVLIFLNMGVPFATLFPPESPQPPFTETDILRSVNCVEDASSRTQEHGSFPEHCFENVIKYLHLCMALCPRAYSDGELLLLLLLVCRVSLETRLQLLPMEDACWVLHHLLNNTRDWASQLPRICLALVNLTANHHNLRRLVQLLPEHKRGKQLRKHLSMSIISKLLNQRCTYKPVTSEFQLSALQQYLPRMRPSSLLSDFFLVKKTEDQREEEDCSVSQDQRAYYLCYSLLTLTNEASNFDTFPSNQKDQLKLLSAVLEKYIKGDIREGEQWLYRSKVKDLVARIYTRWQVLLLKSKPMQGKLHDYWQPSPEDTLSSSQESQQDKLEVAMNIDPHTT